VALASVTFCTAGTQGELVTSMGNGNGGSSTSLGLTTTTSGNGGATRSSTTTTTAAGTSMTATASAKSDGSKVANLSVRGYVCLLLGILGVLGGY
jgi:hypothetical protein